MNRRESLIAGLAGITAIATLTPAAPAAEPKANSAELEKIRALLRAHDAAMTNHDLNGVMATLAPKAVIIGTGPGEVWSSSKAIKSAYQHFFEDFDKGHQDFTYRYKLGGLTSDMGWLVTSGEIKGRKNGKAFSFPINVSLTVTKASGAWRIAAMHFSTLTRA